MCPFKRVNLARWKCVCHAAYSVRVVKIKAPTSIWWHLSSLSMSGNSYIYIFLIFFQGDVPPPSTWTCKETIPQLNNRNNPLSSVFVVHCVLLLSIISIVNLSDQTQPLIMCLSPLVHSVFITPQAPESLLESLETHLNTLEGKKPWVVQYICHMFRFLSLAAATVSRGFNNPVIIQFHGFPAMPKAIEVCSDFGSG